MAGGTLSKTYNSSGYTGKVQRFYVDATHSTLLALGDYVTKTGTGDTNGVPAVDAVGAGTGNPITGCIVGIQPNLSALEQKGLPALQDGYVFVNLDPEGLYELEISGANLTVANIGQNAPLSVTAATQTGNLVRSNMTLNGSGAVATTEQMRIEGLVQPTDGGTIGNIGQLALVRMNESTQTTTAGV
jgi:hypothetical protein